MDTTIKNKEQEMSSEEGWNQVVDEKKRKADLRALQAKEEKSKKRGKYLGNFILLLLKLIRKIA